MTPTNANPSRARLLQLFKDRAFSFGRFTLASGKESTYYVNSKKAIFNGEAVALLAEVLYDLTKDLDVQAVGGLLQRAIATGEIRDDISPEDLLRALVGMCYMHDQPGWQASVLRLVDVFIDGLLTERKKRRSKTP